MLNILNVPKCHGWLSNYSSGEHRWLLWCNPDMTQHPPVILIRLIPDDGLLSMAYYHSTRPNSNSHVNTFLWRVSWQNIWSDCLEWNLMAWCIKDNWIHRPDRQLYIVFRSNRLYRAHREYFNQAKIFFMCQLYVPMCSSWLWTGWRNECLYK